MAESTTKTATKKPVALRGKRIIAWNPENDYRLGDQTPLRGYEGVRKYAFCYVNESASAQVKQTGQPVFKDLTLSPGLNWIEASEWAEAVEVSAVRQLAEKDSGDSKAVDEIAELIRSRAILVFEPNERVQSTGQFTGNLEDYDPQELRRLVDQVDDVAALQEYARDTREHGLVQVIQERISALNTGY